MFSGLGWLGILTCIYALSRLLHYAYLRLKDDNKHERIQKVLISFCIILWCLSVPVSLVMGVINMFHSQRLEDKIAKDFSQCPPSHNSHRDSSLPLEIISLFLFIAVIAGVIENGRLEDKVESLESQIAESEYDSNRQYDNGYDAGRDNGREEGYEEGYIDGLKEGYNEGYYDGRNDGYSIGYNEKEEYIDGWYSDGYEDGYNDGYADASP